MMINGKPEPIRALNRVILVEDTSELPLVELRKECLELIIGSENVISYVRPKVALMLRDASMSLPRGLKLSVNEAWRSLETQSRMYDDYYSQLRNEHPDWSHAVLRRQTNRHFAPYDQKAPPGHCTGGAVDVALIDQDDKPLDMTSPLSGWGSARTNHPKLSPEARRNRMILLEAMLSAGFSNCKEEYWHYSYGDAAWAVRSGSPVCFYGLAELPEK
jgi:D-alanyl-D-alanine dipeptidase